MLQFRPSVKVQETKNRVFSDMVSTIFVSPSKQSKVELSIFIFSLDD